MFEHFIITDHVIERYRQRVDCCSTKDAKKRIKSDLHFTKIRKIVNHGNVRHVFTRNSKEFIFINDDDKWILTTIIKRTRKKTPLAIQYRQKQCLKTS